MRKAYAAGVPLFAGTDSCNTVAFGSHAWELQMLHEHLGLTPSAAIRSPISASCATPSAWLGSFVMDGCWSIVA